MPFRVGAAEDASADGAGFREKEKFKMSLSSNVGNFSSCLAIGRAAKEWIGARKAVAEAKERLERAKDRKDVAVARIVSRIADFSETVPPAYEKFRKAFDAAFDAAKKSEDEAMKSEVGIAEPFEPVDASAVEDFRKAVDPYTSLFEELNAAESGLDVASADVGDATKAERAAFAAFREKVSVLPSRIGDAMCAVDVIRVASEQSKATAKAFIERADEMRRQMAERS